MPAALAFVTTGPSVITCFGMPCPLFSPAFTAATPAMMAPPWMRQEGLRTVANMRPSLTAWIAERALGHDDLALAADRVAERLRHRRAHELIVGRQERMNLDLVERGDQRVHVDHGNAGIDHLLHGLGQRADAEGLDGDEIPF